MSNETRQKNKFTKKHNPKCLIRKHQISSSKVSGLQEDHVIFYMPKCQPHTDHRIHPLFHANQNHLLRQLWGTLRTRKRKAQPAKSGQKSCTILTVAIYAPPAWLAAWSWSTAGRLPETAWWSPDHVPSATCHAHNTLPHGQAGRRVTSTKCPSSNHSVHRWSPVMWGLKCAHHLPS